MLETGREGAPDAQKEGEKYTNWHLTEGDGGFSVGMTDAKPGYYSREEDPRGEPYWVAPGDEVDAYLKENNLESTGANIKRAIESWVERQGNA